jgi:hypothetical protein
LLVVGNGRHSLGNEQVFGRAYDRKEMDGRTTRQCQRFGLNQSFTTIG